MRADKNLGPARAFELHVIFGLRHGAMWDRIEAIGYQIGAGENAEHAGHGKGRFKIKTFEQSMGMGRADHHRIALPVQAKIVCKLAFSGQKTCVLFAPDWLANAFE